MKPKVQAIQYLHSHSGQQCMFGKSQTPSGVWGASLPSQLQHVVALDFLDSDGIVDGFLFCEYILIVFLVHVQFWCPQNPVEMSSKI